MKVILIFYYRNRFLINQISIYPVFSYFTISSANEKLPGIVEKFKNVTHLKNEIMKIEQQLSSSLSPTSNFEQYAIIKQKLNSVVKNFYQAIEDLENTGVVIKGID